MLQRVHNYTLDAKTRTFTLGAVNPVRTYVVAQNLRQGDVFVPNPDYHPPLHVQGGKFYTGDGQQEITREEVATFRKDGVEGYILKDLELHPMAMEGGADHQPEFMRECPVCGEPASSSEMEAHLIEHARRLTAAGPIDPDRLAMPRRRRGRPPKVRAPEATA